MAGVQCRRLRTLQRLRDGGVTVRMVEQNARSALAMSDFGLVLELGQTRMHDLADRLLDDPRVRPPVPGRPHRETGLIAAREHRQ